MKTAIDFIITEEDKTDELYNRFMKFVDVKGEDECWVWGGSKGGKGYGRYCFKGKMISSHRFSYAFFKGPITDSLLTCHSCDCISCVNPKHLFVGTDSENQIDMVNKGRQKGKCDQKLSVENVVIIKKMLKRGFSQKDISSMFEISHATVSLIKTGKNWAHITI